MHVIPIIGATIGGAAAAVALFWFLSAIFFVNGGFFQGQGFAWSQVWLWALVGGSIGALGSIFRERRRHIHALEISAAAQAMGLDHRPKLSRTDLGDAGRLKFFSKWNSGVHHITGQVDGLPVQMFDYTYLEQGDESASYYSQTVALVPGAENSPAFELRPRDLAVRVLGLMGVSGITFGLSETDPESAAIIEQFERRYHLSLGLEDELEQLGRPINDLDASRASESAEDSVRSFFTVDVLRYFGDCPGWNIESNGQCLAFWRRKWIVPGPDRPKFLADVLEARKMLTETRSKSRSPMVTAREPRPDPLAIPAR